MTTRFFRPTPHAVASNVAPAATPVAAAFAAAADRCIAMALNAARASPAAGSSPPSDFKIEPSTRPASNDCRIRCCIRAVGDNSTRSATSVRADATPSNAEGDPEAAPAPDADTLEYAAASRNCMGEIVMTSSYQSPHSTHKPRTGDFGDPCSPPPPLTARPPAPPDAA
jgi:hypothetical protein